MWGVGSGPQLDDISQFKNVSHHTKIGCTDVILKHNTTYYSTVIAFNDALNSKHSNGSSDGGKYIILLLLDLLILTDYNRTKCCLACFKPIPIVRSFITH